MLKIVQNIRLKLIKFIICKTMLIKNKNTNKTFKLFIIYLLYFKNYFFNFYFKSNLFYLLKIDLKILFLIII